MRIILFTGKGGVGKTTTAAATALRLADRGSKTLLLSTDAAHSLADVLGLPITGEPTHVADGLSAVQIDTQRRLEAAWHDVRRYLVDLLTRGGVDPVTADELTVLPGADEILALLAVLEFAAASDWDTLVVDCAPTAETLRLLALPEALSWYLAKVFPAHQRLARGMRPFAALLSRSAARAEPTPAPAAPATAAPATPSPGGLFAALLALNANLSQLQGLLSDPSVTTVRLVLTPEAMAVSEARRTYTALALYGFCVDGVVANRIIPDGDDEWRHTWAMAQQARLAEVRDSFAGVRVRELPYRRVEPVGTVALRAVADDLYGPLPGADPEVVGVLAHPPTVHADGEQYVLQVRLPLAERGDVQVARVGDDLVLTIGANRRVMTLASVLRRCDVVSAGFASGRLDVRFRKIPSLWPEQTETPTRPRTAVP